MFNFLQLSSTFLNFSLLFLKEAGWENPGNEAAKPDATRNKRVDTLSASEASGLWENHVTIVTRGDVMPERFRMVEDILDGRVKTQGRLGTTRTEGIEAKEDPQKHRTKGNQVVGARGERQE